MKIHRGISSIVVGLSMLALAAPAFAATISTQMDIGTRGSDVTTLQQAFAANPSIYPQGLVTGYFGSLSSAAVKRFQTAQGVVSSGTAATTGYGRVGPLTINAFNQVYGSGIVVAAAPIILSVSTPSTIGSSLMWSTNMQATGIVYYSTSPLQVAEATGPGQAPTVGGVNVMSMSTSLGTSNSVVLNNLASHTTYYYMIESIAPTGISVTFPSTFTTQ